LLQHGSILELTKMPQNRFSVWALPRIPLVVGELTTRPDLLLAEDGQTLAIPVPIDAFVVRF